MRATVIPASSRRISSFRRFLFASAIGVGDERLYEDAAGCGVRQCLFNFDTIEAENGDFHAAFSPVDRIHQRRHPVTWLNQQFQVALRCK